VHASKGQAEFFDRLRLRLRAGEISHLELEPAFEIRINGEVVCTVKADASYFDEREGRRHTIDYKGVEGDTPVSRLKRKLVKAAHGVDIEIVGPAAELKARKARKAASNRAMKKAAKAASQKQKAAGAENTCGREVERYG
jgi:hypothetical protein